MARSLEVLRFPDAIAVASPVGLVRLTVSELIRFGWQPHQEWLRQWSAEDQQVVAETLALADLKGLADRLIWFAAYTSLIAR